MTGNGHDDYRIAIDVFARKAEEGGYRVHLVVHKVPDLEQAELVAKWLRQIIRENKSDLGHNENKDWVEINDDF